MCGCVDRARLRLPIRYSVQNQCRCKGKARSKARGKASGRLARPRRVKAPSDGPSLVSLGPAPHRQRPAPGPQPALQPYGLGDDLACRVPRAAHVSLISRTETTFSWTSVIVASLAGAAPGCDGAPVTSSGSVSEAKGHLLRRAFFHGRCGRRPGSYRTSCPTPRHAPPVIA